MNYVDSVIGQGNLIPGDPKDPVAKTGHREVDFETVPEATISDFTRIP